MGRVDDQVKIRGQRVELSEIEHVMLTCALVKQCVVIVSNMEQRQVIIGYVVPNPIIRTTTEIVQQLLVHARKHLPIHMVPALFVILDTLPLNSNGKIDKKRLPQPTLSTSTNDNVDDDAKVDAAIREMENTVKRTWAQVLNKQQQQITYNTNFFEIGGESLSAMVVIGLLRRAHVVISVQQLLTAPTLREFSRQCVASKLTTLSHPEPLTAITPATTSTTHSTTIETQQQEIPMLPSQLDFFTQNLHNIHHHNIVIEMESTQQLDEEKLKVAAKILVAQNPILQNRFLEVKGGFKQLFLPAYAEEYLVIAIAVIVVVVAAVVAAFVFAAVVFVAAVMMQFDSY